MKLVFLLVFLSSSLVRTGYLLHSHVLGLLAPHGLYQPAVLRIHQIILHVEGAANARICDNWSEDIRTVHVIPQPGAAT